MEEVVVTALGQTSKKAKVGYSTTTFNSEAINRTANVNAFDGLGRQNSRGRNIQHRRTGIFH